MARYENKEFRNPLLESTPENRLKALETAKTRALDALYDHDFDNDTGSKNLFILDNVLAPIGFFKERIGKKFEVEDFVETWKLFCFLCKEINEKTIFVPTINTFCNFMNISKVSFDNILEEKTERGEICRYIKDTLADRLMQGMLENKIAAIPGIFIAKANYGMRDNEQPVTNIVINEPHQSALEILNEFKKG